MQLTLSATLLLLLGQGAQALALGTPIMRSKMMRVQKPTLCAVDTAEEAPEPAPPAPEPACDFPGCVDGRVMGGLAAIELFEWWPIKAYRPCPKCASRGKQYARSGQTLDEIVFKKNPKGGYYGED